MEDETQILLLTVLGALLLGAVVRRLFGSVDVSMFAGLLGGTFIWLKLKAEVDAL